jgi:UDP-N-acetylglucosamine acyltransferase
MHRALYRRGLTLESASSEIEALRIASPEAVADINLMLRFLAGVRRGIAR